MFTNHSADDHQPSTNTKRGRGRPKGTTKKGLSSTSFAHFNINAEQKSFAHQIKAILKLDTIDDAYLHIFNEGTKAMKAKIKKETDHDLQQD